MNIECIRDNLYTAVSKAERITTKNTTLPVLQCLLLSVKGNLLSIRATNLDLGVEFTFSVKTKSGKTWGFQEIELG